jgi:hypothetical protein
LTLKADNEDDVDSVQLADWSVQLADWIGQLA